ncbi:hypothetical protein CLOM_g12140, partial [Closterium sp. NIES-68]
ATGVQLRHDLTCLLYRIEEEKAQWIIYVTDVGQTQHFDMFFKAAQKAGFYAGKAKKGKAAAAAAADSAAPAIRVDHVGFGLVLGEDGKRFRTRSSEVVRLVDLLDEAVTRAKQGLVERGRGASGRRRRSTRQLLHWAMEQSNMRI